MWLRDHFKTWTYGPLLKIARKQLQAINERLKLGRQRVRKLEVRAKPDVDLTMNVRNQSDRSVGMGDVGIIVLHDTESHNRSGLDDLRAIGNWFDNPPAQASSHTATDAEGNSARYVPDTRKAWHVGAYNSVSLGIEQIGWASQSSWPNAQVDETARWIALWSKQWGIPIQQARVRGGSVLTPGVITHNDLDLNDHTDPGPNYPFERCLKRARYFKSQL